MAHGPMSSILVMVRITVRIQESEVRNPHSLDYRKLPTDFDEILWRAGVWHRDQLSGSGSPFRIREEMPQFYYVGIRRRSVLSEYF